MDIIEMAWRLQVAVDSFEMTEDAPATRSVIEAGMRADSVQRRAIVTANLTLTNSYMRNGQLD